MPLLDSSVAALSGFRGGLRLSENIPRPDFVFRGSTASPQSEYDHVLRMRLDPYTTSSYLPRQTPFGVGTFKTTAAITQVPLVGPIYTRHAQPMVGHALLWIENCGTNAANFNVRLCAEVSSTTRGIGFWVNNLGVAAAVTSGSTNTFTPYLAKARISNRLVSATFFFTPTRLLFFADGVFIGETSHTLADGTSGSRAQMRMASASGAEPTLAVLQQAFFRGPDADFALRLSADPGLLWERERIWVPADGGATATVPSLSSLTTTDITDTTATLGLTLTF